jgi:hypothetical protein
MYRGANKGDVSLEACKTLKVVIVAVSQFAEEDWLQYEGQCLMPDLWEQVQERKAEELLAVEEAERKVEEAKELAESRDARSKGLEIELKEKRMTEQEFGEAMQALWADDEEDEANRTERATSLVGGSEKGGNRDDIWRHIVTGESPKDGAAESMAIEEAAEDPMATQTTMATIAEGTQRRKPRAIRKIIEDSDEEREVVEAVDQRVAKLSQELEAESGDKRKRVVESEGEKEDEGEDELVDDEMEEKPKKRTSKRSKKSSSPKKAPPPKEQVERVDGLKGDELREVVGKVSDCSIFGFFLTISTF